MGHRRYEYRLYTKTVPCDAAVEVRVGRAGIAVPFSSASLRFAAISSDGFIPLGIPMASNVGTPPARDAKLRGTHRHGIHSENTRKTHVRTFENRTATFDADRFCCPSFETLGELLDILEHLRSMPHTSRS